jgi:hypothetical protein
MKIIEQLRELAPARVQEALKGDDSSIPHIRPEATVGHSMVLLITGLLLGTGGLLIYLLVDSEHKDREVLCGCAAVLGCVGLIAILNGLLKFFFSARMRLRKHPWQRTRYWSKDGCIEELCKPHAIATGIGVLIFGGLSALIIFSISFLVFLIPLGICVYFFLRAIKYSASHLQIDEPYFFQPGQRFVASLHCPRGIDMIESMTVRLAFVRQESVYVRSAGQGGGSRYMVSKPAHSETKDYGSECFSGGRLPEGFQIEFDLPEERTWSTEMEGDMRSRSIWVLLIHAKTPGVDYRSQFLLPIFTTSTL